MSVNVETLLRESSLTYGHIQLFRSDDGTWQGSVCHYGPPSTTCDSKCFTDPVEALRKALMEDDRLSRDMLRRYNNAPKYKLTTSVDDSFEGMI